MKQTLQERIRGFLKAPPPQGMISLPNSFAGTCLNEFAEHGRIDRETDAELLLRETIQSYRRNANESDPETKRYFLETADLLEEVWKQELGRT